MRARIAAVIACLLAGAASAQPGPPASDPPASPPPASPPPGSPPLTSPPLASPPLASSGKPDRATQVNSLFAALKSAQSEQEASILESHVIQLWIDGASPASRLLVSRGTRELQGGAHADAVQDFDALVTLEPTLPEAYHQRALARYAAGDTDGAVRDIERTLELEPRHFPALALLSRIAETRGDWQGAFQAWKKVLALDPKAPGGTERLNMLRVKAVGRDT